MNDKASIAKAENRVKEMERMTKQYVEQSNRYINRNGQNAPRFENMRPPSSDPRRNMPPPRDNTLRDPPPVCRECSPPCQTAGSSISGIQDILHDKDRLLILALMIILLKEKADIKLILALGYILL